MPHNPRVLLQDILKAGSAIESFFEDVTLDEYGGNLLLRSAVERQFEIIGEALRRLEQLDQDFAARISEYRRIIDFRNILAHGYEVIDDETVWQAIKDKLPILLWETKSICDELE